jgi:hypothetical protein
MISAAMVADIFTGFEASAWTAWLYFAVLVGLVILWAFTVRWPMMHLVCWLTFPNFTDHLFFCATIIWGDQGVWELPLSFHISLLLALYPSNFLPLTRTSIPLENVQIHVCPG